MSVQFGPKGPKPYERGIMDAIAILDTLYPGQVAEEAIDCLERFATDLLYRTEIRALIAKGL